MGYKLSAKEINNAINRLSDKYYIYAPKRFKGQGNLSDTDSIRYGTISSIEDIEFNEKSQQSFKEVLLPITQTLFYFTENQVKESDAPKHGAIVFLRSCDIHAVKRLDEIYLNNGSKDYYYERVRNKIKFVLMGCAKSYENCFCVDMGTNSTDDYDLYVYPEKNNYLVDCKCDELMKLIDCSDYKDIEVNPVFPKETNINVKIPKDLSRKIVDSKIWDEYDSRCIGCGRCNFSCPTCTCYTMQDIFYTDNGRVGERRRVWASCMVDGFTDVAGGGEYRKTKGQRMRFKALHKVSDFNERFGYHMCVGCGRCDDICPEYISFSAIINKLNNLAEEVE